MWKQRLNQLHSNQEADQHLCFRYLDSTIPPSTSIIQNFKPLAISSGCTAWFVWDLVRISHLVAYLMKSRCPKCLGQKNRLGTHLMVIFEPQREKTNNVEWILTKPDTNQAVQLLEMARGLKFCIKEGEVLYYPCSKNKGADQLCGYR